MSSDAEKYGKIKVTGEGRIIGRVRLPNYMTFVRCIEIELDKRDGASDIRLRVDRSANDLIDAYFPMIEKGDQLGLALLVNEVKQRALMTAFAMLSPRGRQKSFFTKID